MDQINADRDLLFGLIALQLGLVEQAALVAAFHSWTRNKTQAMADQLVAEGALDLEQRSAIEAIVALHVRKHGGSVGRSLVALSAQRATRDSLDQLGDAELCNSLLAVKPSIPDTEQAAELTATYAVGTATSVGQRFRVLRPYAQGGLGTVFVALDAELHREVALKQIQERHAADSQSRARFVMEAEITGGLEHPGIVPVYGLGTYADGRPYYAMRFIRGDNLKEAITAFHSKSASKYDRGTRGLEFRKLLRRFLDVCNAIEYAHGRGVLHRDLKPGNIVIGRYGETLVVDWGLAKAVGRPFPGTVSEERTLVPSVDSGPIETLAGSALGTPAYMSPEQAIGDLERLGPWSDVYSLGATLYCLLTGKPPFDDADVPTVLRAVGKGEFPSPRTRDPSVAPALEAVCLKAMALDPADRYESPGALAEEIERWMADEPVTARRESAVERSLRWVRRHQTAASSVAVAVLMALVGLAVVLAVQARANRDLRAANGREKARFELAMDAIKTFHTGVSEDLLLKEKGFRELRNKLLGGARDFYGRLERLLEGHTDRSSRAALGTAYAQVGLLTWAIGSKEQAIAMFRRALSVCEGLAQAPDADSEARAQVARLQRGMGNMLMETGRRSEGRALNERARKTFEALVQAQRAHAAYSSDLGFAFNDLGIRMSEEGRADEELAAYERSRKIREALVRDHPDVPQFHRDLAQTLHNLGHFFVRTGRLEQGKSAYERARAIFSTLSRSHPEVTQYRSDLALAQNNLGVLFSRTGRQPEAMAAYSQARELSQAIVNANPNISVFQSDMARSEAMIGTELFRTGHPDKALAAHQRALSIREVLAKENPGDVKYQSELTESFDNVGEVLAETGHRAEALIFFESARRILQILAMENPAVLGYQCNMAHLDNTIGCLLTENNDVGGAMAAFERARATRERLVKAAPSLVQYRRELAQTYHNTAYAFARSGRPADAMAAYQRACDLWEGLVKKNPENTLYRRDLLRAYINVGNLLSENGQPAESISWYQRAGDLARELVKSSPTIQQYQQDLATSFLNTGNQQTRIGLWDKARDSYRHALEILERLTRANPHLVAFQKEVALVHNNVGELLTQTGQRAEATAAFDRALKLRRAIANASPEDPQSQFDVAMTLRGLAILRRDAGQIADARIDLDRSIALMRAVRQPAPYHRYALGCLFALRSSLGSRVGSPETAVQSQADADRAIECLQRAVVAGYRDLVNLRTDTDLDPLRHRLDFESLVMDAAVPADPFARRD